MKIELRNKHLCAMYLETDIYLIVRVKSKSTSYECVRMSRPIVWEQ